MFCVLEASFIITRKRFPVNEKESGEIIMKIAPICRLVLLALTIPVLSGCKKGTGGAQQQEPSVQQTVVVFEGVEPEDEVILKDLLRVDGVLTKGTQYVVSINGQICNVGENLRLTARTRVYNLTLLSISGDRVLVSAIQKQ